MSISDIYIHVLTVGPKGLEKAMTGFYTKQTAAHYARQRRTDAEVTVLLARAIAIEANAHYLDIGCGTGNYTTALAAYGGHWCGLDPSRAMLAKAPDNGSVSRLCAMAEAMPFQGNAFDAAISVLATHHFNDLAKAFAEMERTLKPRRRLAVFSATRHQAEAFWLADYLPQMIAADAACLPLLAAMQEALKAAGFTAIKTTPYRVNAATQDRFFYRGAQAPGLYLSADARAAMSVFRHASPDELERGLARLAQEIDNGLWAEKTAKQTDGVGHYTLLTAQKR